MSTNNVWAKVFTFWPASVAMVLGSFIAGSTPLGGGVVAFPVSVLVLEFTPTESRDASLLVQSVGMNAAAFLLFITKRDLLHSGFIIINILFGSLGMLFGLTYPVSGEAINLIYTVGVFEFGILYFYKNKYASSDDDAHQSPSSQLGHVPKSVYAGMVVAALLGGFLTAKVGSGSDIMLYAYGVFVWNKMVPSRFLSDNHLTASSVVVMGAMSGLTAVTRALSPEGFTSRVIYTWGAMAFVVVMGAPVGSLVLTPTSVPYLRMMFYVLAVVQLALFGALKIKDDTVAWVVIFAVTVVQVALLVSAYFLFGEGKRRAEGSEEKPETSVEMVEGGTVANISKPNDADDSSIVYNYDSSTAAPTPGGGTSDACV
jgi:uncharacterized membrane protein YfcA